MRRGNLVTSIEIKSRTSSTLVLENDEGGSIKIRRATSGSQALEFEVAFPARDFVRAPDRWALDAKAKPVVSVPQRAV